MTAPRGIRNFNPGNIRKGNDKWQGLSESQPDSSFATFVEPTMGIRALAVTLITYFDKYNLNTIRSIVNRWAPPVENDTASYVDQVCASTGFSATQTLDLHTYEHLCPLVQAIIRHENGKGPLSTINTWYEQATIDSAMTKAGVPKRATAVNKVPVTTETVAATGTAGVGVGAIADAAPQIIATVQGQESHLSSGSWFRIAIGVATIILALTVAYAQVKKYKQGVVA